MFFEVVKQFQGEYIGSLLSAMFESMGDTVRPDAGDFMLGDAIDAGLADSVNDNDAKFPPEFRLSKSNSGGPLSAIPPPSTTASGSNALMREVMHTASP